jgi:endonuclease G
MPSNRTRHFASLLLAAILLVTACGEQATQPSVTSADSAEIRQLDYEGFTLWLDCSRRGAVKFQYTLTKDQGNQKRHSRFYIDPDTPRDCQQTSTDSFQKYNDAR